MCCFTLSAARAGNYGVDARADDECERSERNRIEDGDDEGDNNELAQRKGDVLQSIGRQIANLCTGFINANTDDDPEITGEGDSTGSGGDIPIILDGDVEP